jgi:hypothetical protein
MKAPKGYKIFYGTGMNPGWCVVSPAGNQVAKDCVTKTQAILAAIDHLKALVDQAKANAAAAGLIPARFWIARLSTRNFTFEAFGATRAEAMKAFAALAEKHCAHHRVSAFDFHYAYADSVEYREIEIGAGYRDGERV